MKSIRVMFDEALLARLDASEEVRREGRSAVLRRAAAEFLQRRQREMIDEQYRKAYAAAPDGGEELAGWGAEGSCFAPARYRLRLRSDSEWLALDARRRVW